MIYISTFALDVCPPLELNHGFLLTNFLLTNFAVQAALGGGAGGRVAASGGRSGRRAPQSEAAAGYGVGQGAWLAIT
jgi:hypothetical protein